jgi:hypothetical protein
MTWPAASAAISRQVLAHLPVLFHVIFTWIIGSFGSE